MTYATTADVAVRWAKEPDPDETALVQQRLADVERMIRRRVPDLDTRTGDADYLADLVQIEADAVLRLVRNPEGYASETDGGYTYQLQPGTASGRLTLLPEEWKTLGVRASSMFVVAPRIGGAR